MLKAIFLNRLLKSKRFWLMISSVALVVTRDWLNLPVTEDQVNDIVMVVAGWIIGDSLRSVSPPAASEQ